MIPRMRDQISQPHKLHIKLQLRVFHFWVLSSNSDLTSSKHSPHLLSTLFLHERNSHLLPPFQQHFRTICYVPWSQGSVVGIRTRLRAEKSGVRISVRAKIFSPSHVKTGSGAHPAPIYQMLGFLLGGRAAEESG